MTTVHVKANGKVILENTCAQSPFITLELSEEAAKALKYICGTVACNGKFGKYTGAIYDAISASTVDHDLVISGRLEWLK